MLIQMETQKIKNKKNLCCPKFFGQPKKFPWLPGIFRAAEQEISATKWAAQGIF